MHDASADGLRDARRPIASLMSKSEKAMRKVAPGTWQHTMLRDNVEALRIASSLMGGEPAGAGGFSPAELRAALRAIGSMIDRSERSRAKFAPGTSHHSLQANRLEALRIAESLVTDELERDR